MPGQRHLGKQQHVDARTPSVFDDVAMLASIGSDVAQHRSDLGDGNREIVVRRRHTKPCSLRNVRATSSTVFLSTSTLALRRAIVASSSLAESAFRYSASLGFASST